MFVVCLIGVWQHNFEPMVCVYSMAANKIGLLTIYGIKKQKKKITCELLGQ
jgi:hypothetical protein